MDNGWGARGNERAGFGIGVLDWVWIFNIEQGMLNVEVIVLFS
jgi:hypothetical protein